MASLERTVLWLMATSAMLMTTFSLPVAAQPLGSGFSYQGQLTESGLAANGLYDVQVCVFDSPNSPVALACAPDFNEVPVQAGLFAIVLDFGATTFAGQQRYLELRVRPGASTGAFTTLAPRQLLRATPEALRANVASGAPWSGLTGVPPGFADGIDNIGTGTVTSVTAGTGLAGGTIIGSGTIAIANGGVGLAQINTAQVQTRIGSGCTVGQFVRAVNADGSVVCGADTGGGAGTVTSVTAGTGLSGGVITGSGTIAIANGGVGAAQLAPGAVGTAQINPTQVQARVVGSCAAGEYLRGINSDGSVLCEPLPRVLHISTVDDSANDVGEFASIAIGNDGRPVISYYDRTAAALKVAQCANPACTGVATISVVDDPTNNVGDHTSIAIGNDGLPVISYRNVTADALRVAKCVNPACTGAAIITTVDDPANNVGAFTSIAIGGEGRPVISYYDSTAGSLKVARCSNAACTGAATITTVDDPVNTVGQYTSIAIGTDGLPVISYFDFTAGDLKVVKCPNAACTGAFAITSFDTVDLVGEHTSIAVRSDGNPVISYYDRTSSALKVASCSGTACSFATGNGSRTRVDDPVNNVGRFTSLAIGSDDLPVISYWDQTAGALKVAQCANAFCTGTATITTVDDPPNSVGEFTSIAIGNDGLPVISYYDRTAGALKVAKCGTRSCE